jgi:hypothetical protein
VIERVHRLMDRAVECTKISEGLVGEMMRLQVSRQTISMSFSSGAYLGKGYGRFLLADALHRVTRSETRVIRRCRRRQR